MLRSDVISSGYVKRLEYIEGRRNAMWNAMGKPPRIWADMATGCWASSGYSVQGCAQLEQKLRQCMDAPVRSPPINSQTRLTLHSETPTRRRTTSTTTSQECTPRSSAPTSGTRPPTHSFVHYVYPYDGHPYETASWGSSSRWIHRQALWLPSLYIDESRKSRACYLESKTNIYQSHYVHIKAHAREASDHDLALAVRCLSLTAGRPFAYDRSALSVGFISQADYHSMMQQRAISRTTICRNRQCM